MNLNGVNVLETLNLTKKYGKKVAVDSVNLNLNQGEIYGLLGLNGAGKTTLMCMILNLCKKTSGEITIFYKDINNHTNEIYSKVGSIIETPGFYDYLTGEENLKIFSRLLNCREQNISEVLEMVSMTQHKGEYFKNYSLGMKQRLGIALALLKNPRLLILDEPINGLDPVGIQEIRFLLRSLADDYGITILISSHILSEIEHIADTIGILKNGILIEEISMNKLENHINQHVLFEVSDISTAKELLKEINMLEGNSYSINEKNQIELYDNIDKRSDINKMFIEAGLDVLNMSLVRESLEEYFTNLVSN